MEPTPEERAEQEVLAKIRRDRDDLERQASEKQQTQPPLKQPHNQKYIHRRPYHHRIRPHMSFYQTHSLMSTTYYHYPSAAQVLTVPMQDQTSTQTHYLRHQAYYNLNDELECARMQADLEQVQPGQMISYQEGPDNEVHHIRAMPRTWPYFSLPQTSVKWKPLGETEQIWDPLGPNRRGNDPSNLSPLPYPGFENGELQVERDERGKPIPDTIATTGKKSLSTRARKLMGEDVIVVPHTDYPTPQPMSDPEIELKEALHFVAFSDTPITCRMAQLTVTNGATGDGYYVLPANPSEQTKTALEAIKRHKMNQTRYAPNTTYWHLLRQQEHIRSSDQQTASDSGSESDSRSETGSATGSIFESSRESAQESAVESTLVFARDIPDYGFGFEFRIESANGSGLESVFQSSRESTLESAHYYAQELVSISAGESTSKCAEESIPVSGRKLFNYYAKEFVPRCASVPARESLDSYGQEYEYPPPRESAHDSPKISPISTWKSAPLSAYSGQEFVPKSAGQPALIFAPKSSATYNQKFPSNYAREPTLISALKSSPTYDRDFPSIFSSAPLPAKKLDLGAWVSAKSYEQEFPSILAGESAPISARKSHRKSAPVSAQGSIMKYPRESGLDSAIDAAWASALAFTQGSKGSGKENNNLLKTILGYGISNESAKNITSSGSATESGSDSKAKKGQAKDQTKNKAQFEALAKAQPKSNSKNKAKAGGKNKDITSQPNSAQESKIVGSIIEGALDIAGKKMLPHHRPNQDDRVLNKADFEAF
ncbi:platelet binding protein GspB-like isoform X2 [Drosophila bipectinata]